MFRRRVTVHATYKTNNLAVTSRNKTAKISPNSVTQSIQTGHRIVYGREELRRRAETYIRAFVRNRKTRILPSRWSFHTSFYRHVAYTRYRLRIASRGLADAVPRERPLSEREQEWGGTVVISIYCRRPAASSICWHSACVRVPLIDNSMYVIPWLVGFSLRPSKQPIHRRFYITHTYTHIYIYIIYIYKEDGWREFISSKLPRNASES